MSENWAYFSYLSGVIGTAFLFAVGTMIACIPFAMATNENKWAIGGRSGKPPWGKKSAGLAILVWASCTGAFFWYHLQGFQHMTLHCSQFRKLSADNVTSIKIGERIIKDKTLISPFITALNDIQYFAAKKGDWWAQEIPCEITQQSGLKCPFTTARYLDVNKKQDGALLEFQDGNPCLFSSKLPDAFSQAGIEMPTQRHDIPR